MSAQRHEQWSSKRMVFTFHCTGCWESRDLNAWYASEHEREKEQASNEGVCALLSYCFFFFFIAFFFLVFLVFCTENYADAMNCTYFVLCVTCCLLESWFSIYPSVICLYPFRGWQGGWFCSYITAVVLYIDICKVYGVFYQLVTTLGVLGVINIFF